DSGDVGALLVGLVGLEDGVGLSNSGSGSNTVGAIVSNDFLSRASSVNLYSRVSLPWLMSNVSSTGWRSVWLRISTAFLTLEVLAADAESDDSKMIRYLPGCSSTRAPALLPVNEMNSLAEGESCQAESKLNAEPPRLSGASFKRGCAP